MKNKLLIKFKDQNSIFTFFILKRRGMITIFPKKEGKKIVILFQEGKPCRVEAQKLKVRKFHMPLNFVSY